MDSSAVSETLLRMQYAMAVIRVVNGIADSAQKGKVASSVASLASFAGDAQLARASSIVRQGLYVSFGMYKLGGMLRSRDMYN